MDLITHLRRELDRRGYPERITENELVEVLQSFYAGPDLGVPSYADDRDDPFIVSHLLPPEDRRRLGLPVRRPGRPQRLANLPQPERPFVASRGDRLAVSERSAGPQSLVSLAGTTRLADRVPALAEPSPLLRLRVQAVVCRNADGLLSDGSLGQSEADIGPAIANAIAATNDIFKGTGIEFVFYPSADVVTKHLNQLNQDILIPEDQQAKLRQVKSREEFDDFTKPYWTSDYRSAFAKNYPGKLVLYFAEGNSPRFGLPGQENWRWCSKCQGLFFASNDLGACPAGSSHSQAGSGNYMLLTLTPGWSDQHNWRWCSKCQGLFFAGNNLGACPAGGGHNSANSANYALIHNQPSAIGQDSWCWCNQCQGLFYGNNSLGSCPAGGQHNKAGSGNYTLLHNEPEQWQLTSPSTFAFSGDTAEFVRLTPAVDPADPKGYAKLMAHELGHYLHLAHTHDNTIKLSDADEKKTDPAKLETLKNMIAKRLMERLAAGVPMSEVMDEAFDYDENNGPGVDDTAADVGPQLFHYLNLLANGDGACGPIDAYQFSFNLPVIGSIKATIHPPRDNIMSYFKGCMNIDHHFSPEQALRMRAALMSGNRRHLVSVQLGDTETPGLRYHGVWNPGGHGQIVSWRKSLADHDAAYQARWQENMRLIQQQAYLHNGQVRYDGIWNPGSHAQFVSWNKNLSQHNAEYDKMWAKNMRLIHQQALVVGGQVRYDGIWNPSDQSQYVSWSKTLAEHNAEYDKMWGKGMRLIHQQAYLLNGTLRYDGIWNPADHGQVVSWGKSLDQHNALYAKLWGQGMRLIHQQSYTVNGQLLYDGIWNPNQGAQFVSWRKTSEQIYVNYDDMWHQGMRLVTMNCFPVS
jgi:hypothetical protein